MAVDFALQTWEHCGARSKNVRAGLGAEVGLATTILRATLRLAARRAISPALVVCDDMNLASIAVIERCGGALESVVSGSGCGPSQRRLGPDRKIEGRMATPKDPLPGAPARSRIGIAGRINHVWGGRLILGRLGCSRVGGFRMVQYGFMPADDVVKLITEAYVYGFPLVFNLDQVVRYVTSGVGSNPQAPFNEFSHARTLAGPQDTFVTINNDTLYSMAQVDLSVGAVQLHVPDTAGRYYVLQFVDAWTNNFAYVGHRATGTGEGDFVVVPPGWKGSIPEGATAIHAPTRIVSIVGRWACSGADDLAVVHDLQDATRLEPLDPTAIPEGIPSPDSGVPDELIFLEKLRLWSQAFPPAPRDQPLQESLAPTGIGQPGESPYTAADPAFATRLAAGLAAGEATLKKVLGGGGSSPEVNGWRLTMHVFDYNLDYFEVGALDDVQFKITDPRVRVVERAAAALGGLWGNHAYEAVYIMTYHDDHGDQLSGEHTYTVRLDPPPPVGAFWSLTMYDVPNYYLTANPINRYSLGDRTPGIVYANDGSLTITISHERPSDPTALANWLPAPAGEFRPVLRMYEPAPEVLQQKYLVPAITRT